MNTVHFTLQGKGGAGKSLISYIIAQYLSKSGKIICLDTDPINRTFSVFKSLEVKSIEIMKNGNIDQRKFDDLMQIILSTTDDVIIDTGSSSAFTSLTSYLIENDAFELLTNSNKTLFLHPLKLHLIKIAN